MRKGFTLVELLAVIVILAIISSIVTPIVLNTINKTKENAELVSAEFYMNAVEYAVANAVKNNKTIPNGTYPIMKDGNVCIGEINDNKCTGDILKVEVKGEKPTTGAITIYSGKLATMDIKLNDKEIVKSASGEMVLKNDTICKPVTEETKTTGNVPLNQLANGDEYICEVKDNTFYHFFVVGTNENKVNLILDRNINSDGTLVTVSILEIKSSSNGGIYNKVAWINKTDYLTAGGKAEDWIDSEGTEVGNKNKGPITAMNFVNKATENWTNIPKLNEKYTDENIEYFQNKGTTGYGTITLTGRARLPKYSEVHGKGKCLTKAEGSEQNGNEYGSCPLWLVNYLKKDGSDKKYPSRTSIEGMNGYWTISSYEYNGPNSFYMSWYVNFSGMINGDRVSRDDYHGVRPVITVPKNIVG